MSRVIKFRAWDTQIKQMLWSTEINTHIQFVGTWNDGKSGVMVPFYDPRLIRMQFTGLLDKNGKEIYEEDVIEMYGTIDCRGSVKFFYGAWQIDNNGRTGGQLGSTDQDNIEIIGNVFEHPHLLEAS